jgi:zinc protease
MCSRSIAFLLAAAVAVAACKPPEPAAVEPTAPRATGLEAPRGANVPPEIRRFVLGNGLEVIVWPDHDIPNVVFYNFVRAGGRNEYPGITGLSHFFEHMMFNGTGTHAPGDFDRIMEAAGGANNAYTSNDVTVYMEWFPKSALVTIFELEGDRLANLSFDAEVVESERGVVYSERRTRVDNDNTGQLMEQVLATAFAAHPYQFPVIGWPSDIESWTLDDLQDFFRTYYAPNNCTIVVAGDVTPEEILELATKFLGSIPAQAPPAPVRTVEPPQAGTKRVTVEAPAQTPLLHLAFHAGRSADPDRLPLELLLEILAGGESSRLYRLLVEDEQLAISVDAYLPDTFDPGFVYLLATLPPGGDPGAVEERIFDVFASVAKDGVSDAELVKSRNVMQADFWRRMASIDGKAETLGSFAVFHGDYESLFGLTERIGNVSNVQIRDVAARIFRPRNATIGVLYPAEPDAADEPAQGSPE